MIKVKKLFYVSPFLLLLISTALAASPILLVSSTSVNSVPNIKIGLVAPYGLPEGQDMDRAARMAVEEINNTGGIFVADWGTYAKITLVIADTEDASPTKGVEAVTKAIIEDKVNLLIGGCSSATTLADQVVAIENRVPFIITGASTHLVTRRGPQGNYGGLPEGDPLRIEDAEGMSYMFHYSTAIYHFSRSTVHFFAEYMKPLICPDRNFSLAVLYRDDPYGKGVWQASKDYIAADDLPITVVAERKYPPGTTDFHTELVEILLSNPDGLLVVDFTMGSASIFIQGQNDVGLNTTYLAIECCEEPEFYTLLGQWGDQQFLESKFSSYAGPPYYLPLMNTYVPAYEEKYGVTPGQYGATTYDAFYIAKDAIERAGTVNKTAVREAMEATKIEQMLIMTETGYIEFSTESETYHEIAPLTFVQQLHWNETIGECRPSIVWVVPEFPSALILPLLMILALATVLLRKKVRTTK